MRFLKHLGTERPRRAGHRQWLPMVVGAAMLLAFVAPAADELLRGNAFAEEVLVVAEDLDPRLSERLRSLHDSDPEGFAERIAASTQLRALVDMRREDRRAYDMKILELKTDAKVRTLAATVRQARVDGDDAAFRLAAKNFACSFASKRGCGWPTGCCRSNAWKTWLNSCVSGTTGKWPKPRPTSKSVCKICWK